MAELKKTTLDGVEYQAEAEVLRALNQATERTDTLGNELTAVKKTLSEVEADRDTAKERCDQLEEENKKLKEQHTDSAEIEKRVEKLLRVRSVAQALNVEVKDGTSELDTMKAVVLKKFPAAKLDDKDEVYVQSRFDSVVELIEAESGTSVRELGSETASDRSDSAVNPAEAARKRMIKRMRGEKVDE